MVQSVPPTTPARCGGCKKEYARDEVHKLRFIRHMGYDEDGDKRLFLFNCPCDFPGTFSILDAPCRFCGARGTWTVVAGRRTCCGALTDECDG